MNRVKDFFRYVKFDFSRHGKGISAFVFASILVAFLATSALGMGGYLPPVFDVYGKAPYDNYSAFYAQNESSLEDLAEQYDVIGKAVVQETLTSELFTYEMFGRDMPYPINTEFITPVLGEILKGNLAAGRMPQKPYEAVGIMEYEIGEPVEIRQMFQLGETYELDRNGEKIQVKIVGIVPRNAQLPSITHSYGSYASKSFSNSPEMLIMLPEDHYIFTPEEQEYLYKLFYLAQMSAAQAEQFTAEQEQKDCIVNGSNFAQSYQNYQEIKERNTEAQFLMLHIAIMLLGAVAILAALNSARYENENRRERAICYLTGVTPSMLLGGRLVNLFVGFAVSVGVVSAILIPFVNMTLANPGYGLTIYPVHLPFGYLAVVAMFAVMTVIDCIKIKRQNYLNSIHGEAMA